MQHNTINKTYFFDFAWFSKWRNDEITGYETLNFQLFSQFLAANFNIRAAAYNANFSKQIFVKHWSWFKA